MAIRLTAAMTTTGKTMAKLLPENLTFVRTEDNQLVHGRGPYTMIVLNKNTGATRVISFPEVKYIEEINVANVRAMLEKAIEEQLDEDFKR